MGGTPYPSGGTWACTPPRGGSSSGPSGGISGDPFYKLGEEIRKSILGDPEEKARRQEEREYDQSIVEQEIERKGMEETAKKQEQYDRLKSTLQGLDPDKDRLGLMNMESSSSLPLMLGDKSTDPAPDGAAAGRVSQARCPPWDPNKPTNSKIDEKNLCPGNLTCMTYACGGATGCPYVCCPEGLPYLNHCDCKCYSSSEFDCGSYSKCEKK
jgi:hypothetical protein